MTDERPPSPLDIDELVDSLASRAVDGELDADEVPEDLRSRIDVRTKNFSVLRSHLLDSNEHQHIDPARRNSQIDIALAASRTAAPSARLGAFGSSRTSFAVAASILAAVVVSIAILGRSGSQDEVLVSDSVEMSSVDSSASPPPQEVAQDELRAAAPSNDAMQSLESAAALPDYSTLEEIIDAVFEIARLGEPLTKVGDESSILDECADESERHLSIDEALLDSRRVQIHVLDGGDYIVYDSETCSIIFEGTVKESDR